MKSKIVVAGAMALALTLGSGAWIVGNANAAEVVQKVANHFHGKGTSHLIRDNTEVLTLLGMTADELKSSLKSGKTLAELASDKGIDVQKLIDLETKALTAALDQQLKDGKITQEQYDKQKATIASSASEIVNGTYTGKGLNGQDRRRGRGGQGHSAFEAAVFTNTDIAGLLGLTVDELSTQLKAGKSLAVIAGEKNVTVQSLITLEEKAITAALDKQLKEGAISQAQYDTSKTSITKWATEVVNDTFMGDTAGKRGGFGFSRMNVLENAELATLFKLTTDELRTALQDGKTLAALAAEKNVTVEAVTAQITKSWTAVLDKKLADGVITQTQYTEEKAALSTKAAELVNGTFTAKEGKFGMEGRGQGRGRFGGKGGSDQKAGSTGTAIPSA